MEQSFFKVSKRENIFLWVCVAIAIVMSFGFTNALTAMNNPTNNALFMLIGKLSRFNVVFHLLSLLAQIALLGCLWREFSKLGHWLKWIILAQIVFLFLICIGNLISNLGCNSYNNKTYLIINSFALICNILMLVVGILLVMKFKGNLRLYGVSILALIASQLLCSLILVDSSLMFIIANSVLIVLFAFQIICLKMTMKYVGEEPKNGMQPTDVSQENNIG
jgi:hypothetical protein